MTHSERPARPESYDRKIALVLQGGGALGSYQAGVYETLARGDYTPQWVAGISIGAINAAIIAGNPPETRVERLRAFWEEVTQPTSWWPTNVTGLMTQWEQAYASASALLWGQPGFFAPRPPAAWLTARNQVSWYDTSPLKHTLERLVDFDRINSRREIRLSVGAVNVRTGVFSYFDSAEQPLRVEHVMASGALPPGFPPVEIDGEYYWDGGLVSNTPLQYVLDYYPRRSMLAFQVDLFQSFGPIPTNLEQVEERQKDIRYASRTRVNTDASSRMHDVRHAISELVKILPEEILTTEQARRLHSHGCITKMDIAQLIYRPFAPQGASKDFEFSRNTMEERWRQGAEDAQTTLDASPWLKQMREDEGVRVFDVMHDLLMKQEAMEARSAS